MSGISNTFQISGSALNAQGISINTIAKNMANAQVVSGTEAGAYKAQRPVFATMMNNQLNSAGNNGVQVNGFMNSSNLVERQRMPDHPMADESGYVYLSNVNMVEEMTNMIEASRNYQSNVEVLNTSKQLIQRTLNLGN